MSIHSLRFICLLAAITSLAGVSCERKGPDAAWWEGEQERLDLVQQLALKEFRMSKRANSGVEELEQLRMEATGMMKSLDSLTQRRDRLEREIDSLNVQQIDFRETAQSDRRQKAVGRTFDQLVSMNGRTYHQVSVTAVDDGGVSVRHADGLARLRFEDLSDDQRQFFGLDQASAQAADEEETANAIAYDHWIRQRMLVIREKEEARERVDAAAALAIRNAQVYAAKQSVALNVSPLAQPSSDVTSGYSRYRVHRNRYRYRPTYYYYQAPAQSFRCTPGVTYLNRPPQLGNRCNPYYPQGFR